MKPVIRQLALAGLFLLSAGAASAAVNVTYNQPDKFADLPFSKWDREDVLKQLTDHFVKLGKALPQGEDLNVEVLDVDLAGREYPARASARDIRVMRGGADWPRIDLRYTLVANGKVLKSGEAKLRDMDYLHHISRYSDGDALRFEKQMIDEWFTKNIGPAWPDRK
jgi:hypothetical protein